MLDLDFDWILEVTKYCFVILVIFALFGELIEEIGAAFGIFPYREFNWMSDFVYRMGLVIATAYCVVYSEEITE
jgi:hypothetical protein